jgi:hypothetical protein
MSLAHGFHRSPQMSKPPEFVAVKSTKNAKSITGLGWLGLILTFVPSLPGGHPRSHPCGPCFLGMTISALPRYVWLNLPFPILVLLVANL